MPYAKPTGMKRERKQKIGIVGAGSVGATIAYACMVRGVGKHISLFDVAKAKLNAEVLDLNHGLMFVPEAQLDGSDDVGVLKGADAIVITAGAKQKSGQTCIDLVPAIVNRQGVEYTLPVPMSSEEEAGLWKSADAIRSVVHQLGF